MISDDDKMMSHNHKWLMPSKVMMVNQEKGIQFCFTYSPDGKLLACANSSDFLNTITIWQLPSGRERKTIELGRDVLAVHPEGDFLDKSYQVSSLAFSPNGKTLAAAVDKRICFWTTESWKENLGYDCDSGAIIAFSPDGSLLATAASGSIVLWDLARRQRRLELATPLIDLRALAFSPNGNFLAAGGTRGPIKLWHLATGKEIYSFNSRVMGPYALAFSSDSKTLASAAGSFVDIWDVISKEEVANYRFNSFAITAIALSPDGKLLAAAATDKFKSPGPVTLWDLGKGKPLGVWQTREYEPHGIAFSPNGKELAVGISLPKGYVEVWSVEEMLQNQCE